MSIDFKLSFRRRRKKISIHFFVPHQAVKRFKHTRTTPQSETFKQPQNTFSTFFSDIVASLFIWLLLFAGVPILQQILMISIKFVLLWVACGSSVD